MGDTILDHVLSQYTEHDLKRAHASCQRDGDTELAQIIGERLRVRAALVRAMPRLLMSNP